MVSKNVRNTPTREREVAKVRALEVEYKAMLAKTGSTEGYRGADLDGLTFRDLRERVAYLKSRITSGFDGALRPLAMAAHSIDTTPSLFHS